MRLNKRQEVIEKLLKSDIPARDKRNILLLFKNKKIDIAVDIINKPTEINGHTMEKVCKTIEYIDDKLNNLEKYSRIAGGQ